MKLVVQMGHVGRPPNPGSRGTAGEQDFTKAAGGACYRLLNGRGGWQIRLVPADPAAAQYRGDAFVAIHCDGSTDPRSRGASLGHQTADGRALAHAVRTAYDRRGWTGGWKPDNYTAALAGYYGVRDARTAGNTRAFIFETGTLTNPQDRDLMLGPGGHERVALAIGDALGIPVQEDDVSAQEVWDHPITDTDGKPYEAEVFLKNTRKDVAEIRRELGELRQQPATQPIDYDQLAKALLRNMAPPA